MFMNWKKKLSSNGLLYAIIDKKAIEKNKLNIVNLAAKLGESAVDLVQLRAKNTTDADFLQLAKRLAGLFKLKKKIFIINDRADIAFLAKANGLHVGVKDISETEARFLLGQKMILGKTIHNLTELQSTRQEEINYLSLGPFFLSKTKKKNRKPLTRPEIKKIIKKTDKVLFAIGGINRYNMASVLAYGIKNLAVSKAITSSLCLEKKINEFKQCLKKVS